MAFDGGGNSRAINCGAEDIVRVDDNEYLLPNELLKRLTLFHNSRIELQRGWGTRQSPGRGSGFQRERRFQGNYFQAIESALAAAAKKRYEDEGRYHCGIDRKTGITTFHVAGCKHDVVPGLVMS